MMCHNLRLLGAATLFLCSVVASAGPGLIQYQGRLTDAAGNPITTSVAVTFTFWSAATGGTQLGGTYQDTDGVTPNSQGLYSTMIGDETGTKIPDAIFASPQVWLEVKIGSETLSPRKQIVATAYAFQSNWATTATTALYAKTATEADTLATVAGRGASTATQLTLSGGAKIGKISPLTSGGSVQVEGVYVVGGGVVLPSIAPPAAPAGKLYFTSGTLYWNGQRVMLTKGENYVVVHTSADPAQNGRNLLSTYAYAKTLRPYGIDLTTTNRLVVVVPPGRYQLDKNSFTLDAEFVDLAGLTTDRKSQLIYANMDVSSATLVRQRANDVRIENLYLEASCPSEQNYAPAAYRADSSTTLTVMRNCELVGLGKALSMGIGSKCAGRYENVKAGRCAFGYMADAAGTFIGCEGDLFCFGSLGRASGSFTDCKAGHYSFGYKSESSGTFVHCTAGNYSYGNKSVAGGTYTDCVGAINCFAYQGTASGKFLRCTAGDKSFAAEGVASGTFEHCTGGNYSFAYLGTASGTFYDCAAGVTSYGSFGMANGTFTNCKGSGSCFGRAGTAAGRFTGCTAGDTSFGSAQGTETAYANGTFIDCVGGNLCFGGAASATGTFIGCVGGNDSFGGFYGTSAGARVQNCRMTGTFWYGAWAGQMENCHWGVGVNCAATARIYNSTFAGVLNLNNTPAGVTQSRAKSIVNQNNNVFGATDAAALNIANPNVE
ncbi:MAG: hypothetical protein ABFD69_11285 [Candidatus Sumerlaeia bacterium]